jgi:hypothetical protein
MKRPMCTLATLVALAFLMVPAIGADENPACANMEPSALTPPDWYVSECLGNIVVPDAPAAGPWRVPGDTVYFVSLFSPNAALNRRLMTAPIPTFTYNNLAPASVAPMTIFALDFDNAANVLWAIDSSCNAPNPCASRNFGTINQTTGVFTVMGAVAAAPNGPGAGANFAGIRFDPTDGTVFIATITGGISELWALNLMTGNATLRGTMPGGLIIDIAIDNMGQMWGHNISTDQIVRVNKANGATTVVGSTGQNYNFAQGMDFDASDNNLYLFAITATAAGHFARVNQTTGAVTILANGTEELEGAIDVPTTPQVDLSATALAVDTAGNSVMEPSEMAVVGPTWRNNGASAVPGVSGTFSNFTGPAGGTYTIVDANGVYGSIGAGASVTCATPADCYTVQASAVTRPAAHWDTSVLETLNVGSRTDTYTLHVGGSFADSLPASGTYRFIETIFHNGITGGCTGTTFCPTGTTTREQMAVFVLVAKEGAGYTPPACVPPNIFADVPETSPFCRFIEELSNRGVASGCGGGNYCPTAAVTREQMSVFLLRTLDPALNPPNCAPPNLFADVPETSAFCRWIEELANRGITGGCGGGNYCPLDPVTREQMAVFLTTTFALLLYAP